MYTVVVEYPRLADESQDYIDHIAAMIARILRGSDGIVIGFVAAHRFVTRLERPMCSP
jgi:hypothetical protein